VEKLETDNYSSDFHELVKLHPGNRGLSPMLCFCQSKCSQ